MATGVSTVDLEAADAGVLLDRALGELGFVELVGHGIDLTVATRFRTMCDRFFALDATAKADYVVSAPLANRGWRSPGSESLAYSLGVDAPPDVFESFNMGSADRGTSEFHGVTPWPTDRIEGFEAAASAMIAEFERVSALLDRVVGEIVGVDLGPISQHGPDMMAAIEYRSGHATSFDEGQLRMGAHSDYTTFTLLMADPVPGLQIVGAEGSWTEVQPDDGALLMNVGDLLAMLTNDRYPSTLHRVVPPGPDVPGDRRSVAYFHYPNLDVTIAPIVLDPAHEPDSVYDPIVVADHLRSKLAAPKTRERSTGTNTLAGREAT